ncbi:MAG: hypothetical protein A2Z21_09445 [Candidatus Fraserbacteria bacterium RBG_16_55_9]|uniref:VRR-NUC domain-containing protein n=1 Tax=Fraserbacteria sp. (strain RBG_16_55_9) TaxID=1817864 RepID=A0A1F5UNR6_FRAXR|nr:MAG: hypothetical protein A2Z21_09445 [Candidatus Fraserbacteria bacterium RBG_16_55_9]
MTRQIIALLQTLGAYVLKIHGHGMQRRGVPDLACVYKGFAVWIEVKSPNARRGLSPEQQTEIAAIQAAGGVAFEARCIEDVLLGLETIEPKLRERVKVT